MTEDIKGIIEVISKKEKDEKWLQIDYKNELGRKHLCRFIDDMREDYERIRNERFAYKEEVCADKGYLRITVMGDGYFPKDILGFHSEEFVGIRLVDKGKRFDYSLKPCPFCGCREAEMTMVSFNDYMVVCHACGMSVQPILRDSKEMMCDNVRQLLTDRWNRRA